MEEIWLAAVDSADELELDGIHMKVIEKASATILFERRWCAGNMTPFMTGDTVPGLLAGFTVSGENGITTELLFEREKGTDEDFITYRRIERLKECLVYRMSRFSLSKLWYDNRNFDKSFSG